MERQSFYSAALHLWRMGMITKEQLRLLVQKGILTPEEYEMITGEPYEE